MAFVLSWRQENHNLIEKIEINQQKKFAVDKGKYYKRKQKQIINLEKKDTYKI